MKKEHNERNSTYTWARLNMKSWLSASSFPLKAKTSGKREAGRARKLRCDLFQPWISAPHRRPRERSAASRVEYRPFKKGNAAKRTRAFPSSHTAHQFIRSVEKSSEGSHPRRALLAFSVSGPVYAPIGMKLRGGSFVLYLYEFRLVMYSDKEHARVLIAKTRETESTDTSVGNGRAMVGKANRKW